MAWFCVSPWLLRRILRKVHVYDLILLLSNYSVFTCSPLVFCPGSGTKDLLADYWLIWVFILVAAVSETSCQNCGLRSADDYVNVFVHYVLRQVSAVWPRSSREELLRSCVAMRQCEFSLLVLLAATALLLLQLTAAETRYDGYCSRCQITA